MTNFRVSTVRVEVRVWVRMTVFRASNVRVRVRVRDKDIVERREYL